MSANNGSPKLTLLEFAQEANDDLKFIRQEVESFDSMADTLEKVDMSLENINSNLKEIKDVLKDFSKFSINIINKVLSGIFIIILIAMGAKEIPNLIGIFGK